jgi:hypothetical protein
MFKVLMVVVALFCLNGCGDDKSQLIINEEYYEVDGTEEFLVGKICFSSEPAGVMFSVYNYLDDDYVMSSKTRDKDPLGVGEKGNKYCLPFDPGIYRLALETPDEYRPLDEEIKPLEVARGKIIWVHVLFALK